MKKIMKITIVLFIIGSFLFAQNTQGTFGVDVGQVVKYKINEASTEITYEGLAGTFNGILFSENIVDEGSTIKVMVESITATELKWNSSYGLIPLWGICPATTDLNTFLEFLLLSMVVYLSVDIGQIYSTGEIEPIYFEPFLLPLFLDTAPASWDNIEMVLTTQVSSLPTLFSFADEFDYGSTFSRDNSTLSASWWHSVYYTQSSDPLAAIEWTCNSTFSYDMTTGILLEADSYVDMNGSYTGDSYTINVDYNIEKTDISDFVAFLDDYKWYLIGGGSGLIVLILTFTIIIKVKKK